MIATYKNLEFKAVSKSTMEVYRDGVFVKRMMITPFSLSCLDVPAKHQDLILFDLKGPDKAASDRKPAPRGRGFVNPDWTNYNNVVNEGGEGYNPYEKYTY